jgi:hypothetical protein
MPPFKDPSFSERTSRAAAAKQKALDQLRAKPALSEEEKAERIARQAARDAAEAEKRQAKKAAAEQAKAEKAALAAQKAAAVAATPTEAERKAARDARYAARKSRK